MKSKIALFIIIIGVVDIGIILGVYLPVQSSENQNLSRQQNQVLNRTMHVVSEQTSAINHEIDRLNSVFINNGRFVSQTHFINYVARNTTVLGDIVRAYIWIPRVLDSERDEAVSFARQNVLPNFEINDSRRNENNMTEFYAAPQRPEYYPIFNWDPVVATQFLGFDMSGSDVSSKLIEDALNSSGVSISDRLALLEDVPEYQRYGVFATTPNFAEGGELIGYTFLTIWLKPFITARYEESLIQTSIILFDITNTTKPDQVLLHTNKAYQNIINVTDLAKIQNDLLSREFNFHNRKYHLSIVFESEFIEAKSENTSLILIIVIPVGMLLINIIIILIYYQYHRISEEKRVAEEDKTRAQQVLSYVGHEIRNPMNGIVGILEDIKFKLSLGPAKIIADSNEVMSDVHTALNMAEMITHITDDSLVIQKLTAGKLMIIKETINVAETVKILVRALGNKINEKYGEVEFKVVYVNVDEETLTIHTDNYRLRQILLNFLTNALKFTIHGTITLEISQDDEGTNFKVIDTGRGIPPEHIPNIFKPFEQSKITDSTRHGGVGLGLYLCKTLADRLEIDIGFETLENIGTTFWIKIPN